MSKSDASCHHGTLVGWEPHKPREMHDNAVNLIQLFRFKVAASKYAAIDR